MSEIIKKEFKDNPSGVAEFTLTIEDEKITLKNSEYTMAMGTAQSLWLSKELANHIGNKNRATLDNDRVLWFTGIINEASVKDLSKELVKMAFKELHREEEGAKYLVIMINSTGGYCDEGFALIGAIEFVRGLGIPVLGIVMGTVMSMGTCVLQVCSLRAIERHARVMVHEVHSGSRGKLDELEAFVEETRKVNKRLALLFAERNPGSARGEVAYWLKLFRGHDKFLTPEECIERGVADIIFIPGDFHKMVNTLTEFSEPKTAGDTVG